MIAALGFEVEILIFPRQRPEQSVYRRPGMLRFPDYKWARRVVASFAHDQNNDIMLNMMKEMDEGIHFNGG
jgi:hypothetical protein